MDIKLRARLSAYSKLHAVTPEDCEHERVTEAEIDTLFNENSSLTVITQSQNAARVTESEIDSLFK